MPDEWYRRSKSRNVSTASSEPSESTIKRLAALQESDEESDEDEGTAKMRAETGSPARPTPNTVTQDWRGSISQNRFSSMFEGWLRPTSPPSSPNRGSAVFLPDARKSVSEPILVEPTTENGLRKANVNDANDGGLEEADEADFEEMLVRIGLHLFQVSRLLTRVRRMNSASRATNVQRCINSRPNARKSY